METENTNEPAENQEKKHIECPRCKTMVSSQVLHCPICGLSTSTMENLSAEKTVDFKKLSCILKIIVFAVVFIFSVIICVMAGIQVKNEENLRASKDNIQPYLEMLAEEHDADGSISITKELYNNSDNLEFLGFRGNLIFYARNLDENTDITSSVEWVSNTTPTQDEFNSFVKRMDKLKDKNATTEQIQKVSDEYISNAYIWINYLDAWNTGDYVVICKYEDEKIHVRWYSLKAYDKHYAKQEAANTPTPVPTVTPTEKPPAAPTKSNKYEVLCGVPCVFSDYIVTYNSFSLSSDYNGNSVIIENLTFENLSSEARPFFTTGSITMYQEGVELENAYFVDGYDVGLSQRKVQQGGKLDIQEAHILRNKTSPVTIEITDWISFNGVKYTGIIPLS